MTINLTSKNYVLSVTVVLSLIMLAASIVPSFFSTSAFAASDDVDLIVDPTTQVSIAVDENINVDPDLEFSEGCADVNDNDEVTQVNEQTTDQEVHKNNDVGDGGVLFSPTIQESKTKALNYNQDDDHVIFLPFPNL